MHADSNPNQDSNPDPTPEDDARRILILNPKPDPNQDASFTLLRSIWLDFFQLREVETISSIGVEHALVFTATGDSVTGGSVMMRHYLVQLKHLTLTRSPTRTSAT